jgi:nucleotide-binding universal stress UspA family protein
MALDIDLVLVAADGSEESQRATEYATALVERYGADLHLLHFVDTRIMQGIENGDISEKRISNEQQELTQSVRERLPPSVGFDFSGAVGFSTTKLNQTPGSVILDVSEELDADLLVVPRETPSEGTQKVVGKAAYHVIEYANKPVLSV